ncbi:MAG TPA: di-heme oxidoredictase family protein, partial [Gemmataceae bacterium]|nr:di-heme oxidoredictase family protein [Gemmataceae bacterium]
MSRLLLSALIAVASVAAVPGLSARLRPQRPSPGPVAAGPDGRELFAREWVPHASAGPGGDGLGPLFNDSSCVACHNQGGVGGAGPRAKNVRIVTPVGGTTPNGPPPMIGPSFVFHRFSTDPDFAAWAAKEGINAAPARGHVPDRLRGMNLGQGGFKQITERNTTALFGAGPIDALPVAVLAEASVRRFPEYPEVIGRVGRGADGQVGRFGWKAQVGRLDEFVLTACAVELGLQVPGKDQPKLPHKPEYTAPGLDLTADDCAALTEYVRRLPAPPRLEPASGEHRNYLDGGAKAFAAVGCAVCHTPTLGDVAGIYSDLLLHDLGPALSDAGSSYGLFQPPSGDGKPRQVVAGAAEKATAGEWRTPPLWGVRDSAPYLHDGRADTLDEAVALHGGEGENSAAKYFDLKFPERL